MFKYEADVSWEMRGTVRIVSNEKLSTEEVTRLANDQCSLNEVVEPYQSQGSFKTTEVHHLMPCGACGEDTWWTDEDEHECKEEDNEQDNSRSAGSDARMDSSEAGNKSPDRE